MWVGYTLHGKVPMHNSPYIITVKAKLDPLVFEKAVDLGASMHTTSSLMLGL